MQHDLDRAGFELTSGSTFDVANWVGLFSDQPLLDQPFAPLLDLGLGDVEQFRKILFRLGFV